MKIALINDEGLIPSFTIRILDPISKFTFNYNLCIASNFLAKKIVEDSDLLIFQRNYKRESLEIFDLAIRKKIPSIYDIDDNFLDLPKSSSLKLDSLQKNNIEYFLTKSNVVTCSTNNLCSYFNRFNKAQLLENYSPYIDYKINSKNGLNFAIVNTDYFKIKKTKNFIDAIKKTSKEFNIKFTFYGTSSRDLKKSFKGYNNVSFYDCFIPSRVEFLELLNKNEINAALVPLDVNYHHKFKSDIKYLDFSAIKVPCITNNPEVYSNIINNINGLICNDTYDGWLESIVAFLDVNFRDKLSSNANNDCLNKGISNYISKLKNIIEKI